MEASLLWKIGSAVVLGNKTFMNDIWKENKYIPKFKSPTIFMAFYILHKNNKTE